MTRYMIWPALLCVLMGSMFVEAAHANEPLVLRVNNATARPGGQAALVLRTYQTRPVGQGNICMVFYGANGTAPPVDVIDRVEVFSAQSDVIESINITENGDALVVDVSFTSASASVNSVDGPLAAVFFSVSPDALPGTETTLSIEPAQSFLLDEKGAPIPIEIRSGELEIRHPSQPYELEPSSHAPELPGQPASLHFETEEVFRIASGQIALRYSSRELPGTPTLRLDPRYGSAKIKLDGYPGLALIKIVSSDAHFNQLPGALVDLQLHSVMMYSVDSGPSVSIDPALTVLFDDEGNVIPLEIEAPIIRRLSP